MKRYWFKAKEYGWGWYPATWQGWLVIGIWIAVFSAILKTTDFSDPSGMFPFLAKVILSIGILIGVAWKTGERPEWRWAGKPLRRE